MQLGEFELTSISGGHFRLDGGTMFGVVPRSLWSRSFPPDESNRIAQETNCVLVRGQGRTILVDTGYGAKLSDRERRIFDSEEGDPLLTNLAAIGVAPDEIDTVLLSHLHFDHAGGATQRDESGTLVPTFPQATYIAQRGEWQVATSGRPELRGAYPLDNLLPLRDAEVLRFVEGNVPILPGIRSIVTGGHTQFHQALVIESRGETAIFLGDLCPTSHHLPTLWGMSYDVDQLQTRRKKREILGQVADGNWLALLDHDPEVRGIRIQRDPKRDFAVRESLERL